MRMMFVALLMLTMAGCAELVAQPPAAPGGRYVCEDGKVFLVEFAGDGSTAAVTYDNRKITLPQAMGGTDLKYADGQTTLYLDGPRALLETTGIVFARGCVQR